MKETPRLLAVPIKSIPPEGLRLEGVVTAAELEIPEDDRQACPEPFRFELLVSEVSGGVLAQGRLSGAVRCRCDRCLLYYTQDCPDIAVCHDYPPPLGETVDLTEDVRDDILLVFPQRLLCSPECRGLCPECGQNLNVRECSCAQGEDGESVWSALDALRLPDGAGGKPAGAVRSAGRTPRRRSGDK